MCLAHRKQPNQWAIYGQKEKNVEEWGKSKQPRQKMGRSWQGRMKRARSQNIDRLWSLLTENQTITAIARNMAAISAHVLPKKNGY